MTFPARWESGPHFKPPKKPRVPPQARANPVAKPTPKVVERVLTQRAVAGLDRSEKEKVRKRDGEACRVCGGKSREVHEVVFKSKGGVASLENSMVACRRICHRLLQGNGMQVLGPTCNGTLTFRMSKQAALLVFRGRAVPKHIDVI